MIINNKRHRSWTTIRGSITQERMRKNTVDKNKEKYQKGVNVERKEINRRIIRPQRRREMHERNNRIRGRKQMFS